MTWGEGGADPRSRAFPDVSFGEGVKAECSGGLGVGVGFDLGFRFGPKVRSSVLASALASVPVLLPSGFWSSVLVSISTLVSGSAPASGLRFWLRFQFGSPVQFRVLVFGLGFDSGFSFWLFLFHFLC